MRFKKQPRHPFEDTRRKRLAALRSQQRQRDALPLLAPLIAAKQPTVDQVMTDRAESWTKWNQEQRDRRAEQWRRGRARLASYEPETRAALLSYWNGHRWLPADPVCLLDMMHMFNTGRLALDEQGKVKHVPVPIKRDEAIEAIGRKPIAQGWLSPGGR